MNKINKILIGVIYVLFCPVCFYGQNRGEYVWGEKEQENNSYYYFRNEFNIKEKSDLTAVINLYAYSRYALYVNETYINFGPVRSYPQHPYYDTYDISPYLKEGKNIIAVQVMNNGMETFQIPGFLGVFNAWGNIKNERKEIHSFATPGNWICRKAEAYFNDTPRFSFAKGPVEVYDARKEVDDWKGINIDRKYWHSPVMFDNNKEYELINSVPYLKVDSTHKLKNKFGDLKKRTIPYLTQQINTPLFAVNKSELMKENIYNIHAISHQLKHRSNKIKENYIVECYIYSPHRQTVNAGISLGKYILNGKPLEISNHKSKKFRRSAVFSFKQGWNHFKGEVGEMHGAFDFMLSFPEDAGIKIYSQPQKGYKETLLFGKDVLKEFSAKNICSNPAKYVDWREKEKKYKSLYDETEYITIPKGSDMSLVFDMGKMFLGRIFIEIESTEGTTIDIAFSEDLDTDSVPTLYKRNQINAAVRFVADGKKNYYETFKPYGLRFLEVNVSGHTSEVLIKHLGVVSQVYPYKKRGSFECSDPLLTKIWEMGWRTLQVCSEDTYIDTPFRERGHYAGDLFPEYAVTAVTSGDPRLLKHTIRVIMDMYEESYKHNIHASLADYPLINLLIATWYIRQYNDIEFAKEIYPVFESYMEGWWNKRDSNGFISPPKTFFEWTQIDKSATLSSLQVLFAKGFQDLVYLGRLLKETEDKLIMYEKNYVTLEELINKEMWNDELGVYFDGVKNGEYLDSKYPNSTAYPLIWGIVPDNRISQCMDYLNKSLLNIGPPKNRHQLSTPYGGFYALAALYKYGNAKIAESYIRHHWGRMVYEMDDTTWEDFNRDNHSTMSHAWSASPTYYMSTQILGVDLGFPFRSTSNNIVNINPQSESLTWAKGVVPHPLGDIYVEWEIKNNILFLSYKKPKEINVRIEPVGRLSKYKLVLKELK